MARRIVRPYGSSIPATRVVSLLLALMVLGVMYDVARRPSTWRWLASEEDTEPASAQLAEEPLEEVLIEGPNDLDPDELAEFRRLEELITDRTELRPREMPLYWQLMGWSRSQPFAEFEERAIPEPAFVQLWDDPTEYRGQPIRFRMHVRRVLEFEARENPLNVETVYEAWGWTDESKSFPYVIVFTEKPKGLPIGPEVSAEVVFVGYLLKTMEYTAFDAQRGAPLLVGKVRMVSGGQSSISFAPDDLNRWIFGGILAAVVVGGILWILQKRRRSPARMQLPETISDFTFQPLAGNDPFRTPDDTTGMG